MTLNKPTKLMLAAACLMFALGDAAPMLANCCHGRMVTFQVPWATWTIPTSLNASGSIAGYYSALSFTGSLYQGFVRDPDGNLTTFNPGGSLCGHPNIVSSLCSTVSINDAGEIAGFYFDAGGTAHGFAGNPTNGPLISFEAPGARGTFPMGIDSSGLITGFYQAADYSVHGFLSSISGAATPFDFPFAGLTMPTSISPQSGWVVGIERQMGMFQMILGFHCELNCSMPQFATTFNTAGYFSVIQTVSPANLLARLSINSSMVITGPAAVQTFYPLKFDGFVLDGQGNVAVFAVNSSTLTFPMGIDELGDVAGAYFDANNLPHAFVREASGYFPFQPNADPAGSVCAEATATSSTSFAGFYSTSSGCKPPFLGFVYLP